MEMRGKRYEELLERIQPIRIIDTHEHLPVFERKRNPQGDFFTEYLVHYLRTDLISAGLDANLYWTYLRDPGQPILDRFHVFEPFWKMCKHTGYGQSILKSMRGLYGIEDLCEGTIETLNQRICESITQQNHYEYVLKQKSHIEKSLVVSSRLDCDDRYFAISFFLDDLLLLNNLELFYWLSRETGRNTVHFSDWLEAFDLFLNRALDTRAVCLKCAMAYNRSLRFPNSSYDDARHDFDAVFEHMYPFEFGRRPFSMGEHYQNYMLHRALRLANERGAVVQFHTGLQEGNRNLLSNSNPTHLNELFIRYPDVKFDLFHIGYPYQREIIALCKCFPNVYVNMCWTHIISPRSSVEFLLECFDAIPSNKVMGFGGDYEFIDGVYGHQLMARENIAEALSIQIDRQRIDMDEAEQIAALYLYQNPTKLYGF